MLLKKRKWLTLLMACVCVFSILAGCGNTAQPSESTGTNQTDAASQEGDSTNSDNGSEIKVVMARSIDSSTLDPAMASKNRRYLDDEFWLWKGLVRSSEDGKEIEPAVADKWEISDDSLTYTFHLRGWREIFYRGRSDAGRLCLQHQSFKKYGRKSVVRHA